MSSGIQRPKSRLRVPTKVTTPQREEPESRSKIAAPSTPRRRGEQLAPTPSSGSRAARNIGAPRMMTRRTAAAARRGPTAPVNTEVDKEARPKTTPKTRNGRVVVHRSRKSISRKSLCLTPRARSRSASVRESMEGDENKNDSNAMELDGPTSSGNYFERLVSLGDSIFKLEADEWRQIVRTNPKVGALKFNYKGQVGKYEKIVPALKEGLSRKVGQIKQYRVAVEELVRDMLADWRQDDGDAERTREDAETLAARLRHLEESELDAKDTAVQAMNSKQAMLQESKELILEKARLLDEVKHAECAKERWEREAGALAASVASLQERNKTLETSLREMTDRLEGMEARSSTALAEAEASWTSRSEQDGERRAAEEERLRLEADQSRAEARALQTRVQELTDRLHDAHKEAERSGSSLSLLASERARLDAEAEARATELEAARERAQAKDSELALALQSFSEANAFHQSRTQALQQEKEAAEAESGRLAAAKQQLEEEKFTLRTEKAETAMELKNLVSRVASLEEEAASASAAAAAGQEAGRAAEQALVVERELHAQSAAEKSELRTEHTAVCAQLLAVRAASDAAATGAAAALEEERGRRVAAEQAGREEAEAGAAREKEGQERVLTLESELRELREMHATVVNAAREQEAAAEAAELQEQMERLCALSGEADVLKRRNLDLEDRLRRSGEQQSAELTELRQKLVDAEACRRKMHNVIQELRGNIRVFVRTRPFLPSDDEQPQLGAGVGAVNTTTVSVSLNPMDPTGGQTVSLSAVPAMAIRRATSNPGSSDSSSSSKESGRAPALVSHTFDRAFAPTSGQDAVFGEVSEFVQSAMDGFDVCLFSYGQTGSGKTHTMQGSGTGQMRGIIPRSIEKIMETAEQMREAGWEYQLQASFLEIYNENIRDLLASSPEEGEVQPDPAAASSSSALRDKRFAIKHSDEEGTVVAGLRRVSVGSEEEVEELMRTAARHRSVAATKMNSVSSRSHSVFMLHITGVNSETGTRLRGSLNLCDLAGSERLDRSQATGKQLKEAQNINRSLSCLSQVFLALAQKAAHVPFRNSKLTYLLQRCLSGDGKTLMIVNLSPSAHSYHESVCSLRFAATVGKVELGKPKRQLQIGSSSNDEESSTTGLSKRVGGVGGSGTGLQPLKKARSGLSTR